MRRIGSCVLFASLILLFSAITLYFTVGQAIKHGVYQSLVLSPHAARYADWIDIKGEQLVEFWFWNVTNSKELAINRDPELQQVGPFTYKLTRHKYDVVFKENSSAVSYKEEFKLAFVRSLSVADETTNLTIFNFAALSILNTIDTLPAWIRKPIVAAIYAFERDKNTNSFIAVSREVKSILFGYEDPLLKSLKENIPFLNDIDDKIVLFPNPFNDEMEVSTGVKRFPQTVLKWRGLDSLKFYNNNYCNMINGTEGTLFETPLKERVYVFVSDLCRSVEIQREGFSGKTLADYKLSDRTLSDSSVVPENSCFDKLGSGLFMAPCHGSSAVVFSNPHFLGANRTFTSIRSGMNPNEQEHLTRLSIDRQTGYPVTTNKRLQLNFLSPKHADFSLFRPSTLYPVVWMNQSFNAREEDISLLWRRVYMPKMVSDYASLCLACMAALSILVGVVLMLMPRSAEEPSENSPLLNNAF